MAAEAVALLKEFYLTGNPKGVQPRSAVCTCVSSVPLCATQPLTACTANMAAFV